MAVLYLLGVGMFIFCMENQMRPRELKSNPNKHLYRRHVAELSRIQSKRDAPKLKRRRISHGRERTQRLCYQIRKIKSDFKRFFFLPFGVFTISRTKIFMNDLDFNAWTCPLPLRDYPKIVLGHGGGGKLSNELIENIFLPAFSNEMLEKLGDSASIDISAMLADGSRLAFSTDSFVVSPLFFPGGNIGDLAVNGTVNDVAMSGAQPLFLSSGLFWKRL